MSIIPLFPPHRQMPKDLPVSAKRTFMRATMMRWDVSAWITIAKHPETFYAASSEERSYSAGDVKTPVYISHIYTIEARDPKMPLGFRADYERRAYVDERKSSGGAFVGAQVVDPVGIPREMKVIYKPPFVSRGKFETEKSYKLRADAAIGTAKQQAENYNDGSIFWANQVFYATAKEFEYWLYEWDEMLTQKDNSK